MKNGIKPNPEITGEMKPKLKYESHQRSNTTAELIGEYAEQTKEADSVSGHSPQVSFTEGTSTEQNPSIQDHSDSAYAESGHQEPFQNAADGQEAFFYEPPVHMDNHKKKKSTTIVLSAVIVLLLGIIAFCAVNLLSGNKKQNDSDSSLDAISVEKPTETNGPVPTNTPMPTNMPSVSETPVPTNTPLPSETQMPVNTPLPSETQMPTNTPLPSETTVTSMEDGAATGEFSASIKNSDTAELINEDDIRNDPHAGEAMIRPSKKKDSDIKESALFEESMFIEGSDDHNVGSFIEPGVITKDNYKEYFTSRPIQVGDDVYNRIYGRSYKENENIQLSELRYLTIPYYTFNGQIRMGEMIVNEKIAIDVLLAFRDLYKLKYQFNSIQLVDDFWTGEPIPSDTASIHCNNTSCFNYRVSTLDYVTISPHGYGCAIDINPLQNPYVDNGYIEDPNAYPYEDRTSGLPHVITHEDACYKVFVERYGFTWGGDWINPKDYQHFEKKVYEW